MEQITLRGGDYRAVIDVAHGANCISLRNERYGISILREPPVGQAKDNPFLYGMPLLFPANRISSGRFFFEKRLYDFGINEENTACHLHGLLHDRPFEVAEANEGCVKCKLEVDKDSIYPSFPHRFCIRIEYTLDENGLSQRIEVSNRSSKSMPCLLGFHTTFNARTANGEPYLVSANVGSAYERDSHYLPTGYLLPYDAIDEKLQNGTFIACGERISRHYSTCGDGLMTLTDQKRGLRILYENDKKYAYRLIFNGKADEFICLEPQNCLVNAPNAETPLTKRGFDVIGAYKTKIYKSKIYIQTTE